MWRRWWRWRWKWRSRYQKLSRYKRFSSDNSYLVMISKVVKIVKEVKRSGSLWRFACGDVLYHTTYYLRLFWFKTNWVILLIWSYLTDTEHPPINKQKGWQRCSKPSMNVIWTAFWVFIQIPSYRYDKFKFFKVHFTFTYFPFKLECQSLDLGSDCLHQFSWNPFLCTLVRQSWVKSGRGEKFNFRCEIKLKTIFWRKKLFQTFYTQLVGLVVYY